MTKQERGELVWPNLDVDPGNVTGVEETDVAATQGIYSQNG